MKTPKWRTLVGAFLALWCCFALTQEEANASEMEDYANLIRAQGAYTVNIAEARLKWAQAAGVEAQTAGKIIALRFLEKMFRQFNLELNKANKLRANLERRAQAIEDRARTFRTLLTGRNNQFAWGAWNYLTINAIPVNAQLDALSLKVEEKGRTRDNFIDAQFDFPGESVGELLDWLQKTRFSLKRLGRGSAYAALAQAVDIMATPATQQMEKLREDAQKIRPEDQSVWKPANVIELLNGGQPIFQPFPGGQPPPIPMM